MALQRIERFGDRSLFAAVFRLRSIRGGVFGLCIRVLYASANLEELVNQASLLRWVRRKGARCCSSVRIRVCLALFLAVLLPERCSNDCEWLQDSSSKSL